MTDKGETTSGREEALERLNQTELIEAAGDQRAERAGTYGEHSLLEQLTNQMERLTARLEGLREMMAEISTLPSERFEDDADDRALPRKQKRSVRPPLPEPRLVRQIILHRQLRAKFFPPELFADPAWDMLLDLAAARETHQRVSVTSLCIASGVPPTTALRWIGQMVEAGLFLRIEDSTDRRRAFIALTDRAADAVARYFDEISRRGAKVI